MTGSAYLLIQTGSGRVASTLERLQDHDDVDEVAPVTGPYDLIARISGTPLDDALDRVRTQVQADGASRTLTCPLP